MAKPPAFAPYHMASPELEELKKQLKELLDAGHIRPLKAPFGVPFVVVYRDDIVIYSNTLEEHMEHLRKVFQVLQDNELYIKRGKCKFAQSKVNFLGHVISNGELCMDEAKDKQPMTFDNRKLNETERRYTVQEKEMTAIKKLTPKQARWQDFLAEFDYALEYKPGKGNVVADALSRKAELAAITSTRWDIREAIKEGMQHDPTAK
ncbi:uncharacterized protein LOC142172495 [Nicotiana tabacum]|uniref:Uncharacterized protein LOC142172495 n=1 Tax=Nicotiana tabacum TaxID=4097 RepID=A0AC58T4T4_TOBAC